MFDSLANVEKRLDDIEKQIIVWRTALIIISAIALGWLGVEHWIRIPQAVDDYWHSKVGQELEAKISWINSKAIEDKLGITDIKKQLETVESDLATVKSQLADVSKDLARKVSLDREYHFKSTVTPPQGYAVADFNLGPLRGVVKVKRLDAPNIHVATTWIIEQ